MKNFHYRLKLSTGNLKLIKMTDKLKSFLERHNYKITAVNTLLIIIGISIGFWQDELFRKNQIFHWINKNRVELLTTING